MSGLTVEMMWMSTWSMSASPWTAPQAPACSLSRYRNNLSCWPSQGFSMELILLIWSFSVCIARVFTDYNGWYVLSELGEAIMCVWICLRYSTSCSLGLVSPGWIPKLSNYTATAEKRQLPSLVMSPTEKSLSGKRIQSDFICTRQHKNIILWSYLLNRVVTINT